MTSNKLILGHMRLGLFKGYHKEDEHVDCMVWILLAKVDPARCCPCLVYFFSGWSKGSTCIIRFFLSLAAQQLS